MAAGRCAALICATYFDADTEEEVEVRRLANALYRRADWGWACNGGPTLSHGWKPETGFLPYRYEGYDEGLLLYLLALGSEMSGVAAYGDLQQSYKRAGPISLPNSIEAVKVPASAWGPVVMKAILFHVLE